MRRPVAVLLALTTLTLASAATAAAAPVPGSLVGWGFAGYGALGGPPAANTASPRPIPLPAGAGTVVDAAVGEFTGIAATASGGLYDWGLKQALGVGGTQGDMTIVGPQSITLPGAHGTPMAVAATGAGGLALTSTGELYGWGYNGSGQLVQPSTGYFLTPVLIQLPLEATGKITQIAAGRDGQAFAVTSTGELWAWGSDNAGSLGLPVLTGSNIYATPQHVTAGGLGDQQVVDVAAGRSFGLARTANGRVWAFGSNARGEIGTTPSATIQPPTPISLFRPIIALPSAAASSRVIGKSLEPFVTAISAGFEHALVIANGAVYTWGYNSNGQLGRDTGGADDSSPNRVALPAGAGTPVGVAAGDYDSHVTTATGAVVGFGDDSTLQLGNPALGMQSIVPTLASLPDGMTISKLATGVPATGGGYFGGTVLAIVSGLTVATSGLPDGRLGVPYATTLQAGGGQAPRSWSTTDLPAGLTLDGATGAISGTPTAKGSTPVTATVTDRFGTVAQRTLTLVVGDAPASGSTGGSGGAGGASAGAGSGGAGPGTATGAGATVTKPAGRAKLASLRASGATLRLAISCAVGGGVCQGKIAVAHRTKRHTPLATKTYNVAAGRRATIVITINKSGRAALKKARHLAVTVTLTPAVGAAVSRKLTLATAKPKKKSAHR
jgi:alpha-tubulin suppressor-like RCC1 family protein